MRAPQLTLVVPCYNEEEVLPETIRRLNALIEAMVSQEIIDSRSHALFVDDGSSDKTWNLIVESSCIAPDITRGLKLSRNRGHQLALLAGILEANGDIIISIDADLQDDLEAIPKMIYAYLDGYDIVYGVRISREKDSVFKRLSAQTYYRLLARLGVEIIFNHADYRLLSRRAVNSLRKYEESNVFLRGIIPQLGYRSTSVTYSRQERFAGETKYPLGKMIKLAWDGVSSFSTVPLRLITAIGVLTSIVSLSMGVWALGVRLFTTDALPGWASIVIPLFMLSGVQLVALGIMGEYLAKIFSETKRRPKYLIQDGVGCDYDGYSRRENEPRSKCLSNVQS